MPTTRLPATLGSLFARAVRDTGPGAEPEAQSAPARTNVAWSAERARTQGASIMIEAVNSYEKRPYLGETISRPRPRIGHVQLADPPSRGEPGTGEINCRFVLDLLEHGGSKGWV